ncbi:MAG: indole-3-glycerol phosphate synthase TrpC [Tannerellaceae bacterium]|jgi:indole-3-glycerol phosphate synthase|nr:indole-3-glycerol phosphate synthase TrpC [Tannerellaceae bacterium]
MKDILTEIVHNKRIEVERQKKAVDLPTLIAMGHESLERKTRSMREALAGSPSGIIAEFKRKSPSKGWFYPEADVASVVPEYERAGASACSILTDGDYFGGSLRDLQRARNVVQLPLLRKDFIIDPYQVYQARIMGADAILLIAAVLERDEALELSQTAHALGLEVLLEVHDERELDWLNPSVDMLGVNNRHLGTFHTDVENSFRLAGQMAGVTRSTGYAPLMVSESGLSDWETVARLRQIGFRGFLIGEAFMKTKQPGNSLSGFIGGGV